MKHTFNLSKEERDQMIAHIQTYYEEQGEPIGELKAILILDFFIEKLAPFYYNQGVKDAHEYMTAKIDDLFEIEKHV